MGDEAVEDVMGVLPDGFGNDQRGVLRDLAEDLHAVLLGVDEAVFLDRVARVGALDFVAFAGEAFGEFFFHGFLLGPAFLVGGEAQVAVCDEVDVFA